MTIRPKAPADWHRGITRETSRGRLALWALEPGILVFQLVAHGDKAFVAPIVEGFERCLAHGPFVNMFVDTERMATYDSELRTEVTAALLRQRRRIGSLHIVVGSKLVAMGVSVANLALGGMMTIYRTPTPFLAALQSATLGAGVIGFSAHTLAVERKRLPE
jgi:hypothetical protein